MLSPDQGGGTQRRKVLCLLVCTNQLWVFLHVLSGASEYDELPVRHNEDNYNRTLSKSVPLMVDEHHLDDPHVKTNLLFQAHFSRVEMPISDYITDLKSVLDQSIRIIQAMIDICANSGWLSSTMTCMHLMQMVMQGLWYGKDSSLWMLSCMSDELFTFLNKNGVNSVQDLLNLPTRTLRTLCEQIRSSQLYEELEHFPRVQANLEIEKRDPEETSSHVLSIKLRKLNAKRSASRAFLPRFPKATMDFWCKKLARCRIVQVFEVLFGIVNIWFLPL